MLVGLLVQFIQRRVSLRIAKNAQKGIIHSISEEKPEEPSN